MLSAQEISLFDKDGNPFAYIAVDDESTIYSWAGTPTAYLVRDNNQTHIYSFQGKHLGWFEEGVVRDHSGHVAAFTKGSITNVLTKLEPLKALKQLKPLKSVRELSPLKPINSLYFSNSPFSITLSSSSSSSNGSEIYGRRQELVQVKPYISNNEATLNLLNTQLQYQQKMSAAGFVFDRATNMWVTKEFIQNRAAASKECVINAWQRYNLVSLTLPLLKKGTHVATLVDENGGNCLEVKVTVNKKLCVKKIELAKGWKYDKNKFVVNRHAKLNIRRKVYIGSIIATETGNVHLLFLK